MATTKAERTVLILAENRSVIIAENRTTSDTRTVEVR